MPLSAYRQFLQQRHSQRRHRLLRTVVPLGRGRIRVDGRELLNFSSNDYLGLANHPALIERSRQWTAAWGTGSTASRLVCGNLEPFERVEHRLARGKGSEAALVFNSGFQANSTILDSLLSRRVLGADPLVYSDRLNHASIHHGLRAAGVRQIRYRHNDLNHLETLLKRDRAAGRPRFILSETVFSMDGDRADVAGLIELKKRHGAFLYLDEAHAAGVLGPDGFGLAADHPGAVDLTMGTFSKGLGGFGAYAACSATLRDYLINQCSGFIYATALPPGVLGAMDAALELLPTLGAARQNLLAESERLRRAFGAAGLDCGPSSSQIIPLLLGDDEKALAMSRTLENRGILAIAIRPPTVPPGGSRIRFSLSAAHAGTDVDRLIDVVTGR